MKLNILLSVFSVIICKLISVRFIVGSRASLAFWGIGMGYILKSNVRTV